MIDSSLGDIRYFSRSVTNDPSSHTLSVCVGSAVAILDAKTLHSHIDSHEEEYSCYSYPVCENIHLTNPSAWKA